MLCKKKQKKKLLHFLAPPGSGDPTDGRRAEGENNIKKGESYNVVGIILNKMNLNKSN